MNQAYEPIFLSELGKNTWNFAIKRAQLAATSTPPIFGKDNYFPLPGDFLFLAPEETTFSEPRKRDYQIEDIYIVSSLDSPIDIRYVSSSITESKFDVRFAEAFAYALAIATCEQITNSNTKLQNLVGLYDEIIRMARKKNSIQNAPVKSPTCSWITTRL